MQTQQAPFFRPVQTSNYFSLSHQPAIRATSQPHRQQTQANFFKPTTGTSGQAARQRGKGEECLRHSCTMLRKALTCCTPANTLKGHYPSLIPRLSLFGNARHPKVLRFAVWMGIRITGNIRAILKAEGAWEQGSSSGKPPQRLSWLKPSCLRREETGYLPSIAGCNKKLRK